MSPRDKVSKASWLLIKATIDSVDKSLIDAISSGRLKLDNAQLGIVRDLAKASVEAGYHRAHTNFMREIDAVIEDVSETSLSEAMNRLSPAPAKKKRGDKPSGSS